MKTKKQIERRYLKSGGDFCPFCGSSNLVGGDVDFLDGGVIVRDVCCENCDNEWTDLYKLTGIEYDGVNTLIGRHLEKFDVPQN